MKEANRQRANAGLSAIREKVTSHTLRYTCIASLFAAGADQEYVADQVGHEDVTTTNRIYRYVLQRRRKRLPPIPRGERPKVDVPETGEYEPMSVQAVGFV